MASTLTVRQEVLSDIVTQLSCVDRERIGIIGGTEGVIDRFAPDCGEEGDANRCSFSPQSADTLARWSAQQPLTLFGVVHSHPPGHPKLSLSDIRYAAALCQANGLDSVCMGVVSDRDLWMYQVTTESQVIPLPIEPTP